jgi:aminopeptidase N
MMNRITCLFVAMLGACAFAQTPGYEEETGRDLRRYPPGPSADFTHMALEIFIEDMNTAHLSATQRLTFVPLGEPMSSLTVDAKAMEIRSVEAPGYTTTFVADGARLVVTFAPPLPPGREVTLTTSYEVHDPPLGLVWTPESPEFPGRAAQLHTQGQPETNSYWFPCHDFPNDRMTTEISVTVPQGYLTVSNGRLVERRKSIRTVEGESGEMVMRGYERWHWVQDRPHVAYLVTLVVGKFEVVDVGDKSLSMPVYVEPGRGADVMGTFGRTAEMVRAFERALDEPYPWNKYAQVTVWNFGSGGMENTSATTLWDGCVIPRSARQDHDSEGLIAHELAHQWFGDLTTCNSWEHIWLNEGLATFMNNYWLEVRDGRDAYLSGIRGEFDSVIGGDTVPAPAGQPMASKVYEDPWETFRRPANPYSKGASVMHMLREQLGDSLFWKGLATFIDRHKFHTVETLDLQRAMEDASGESLEQFFAQWVFRPLFPRVLLKAEWNSAAGVLRVSAEQTQTIDGDNPAFEFDLPILVGLPGGKQQSVVVQVRGRSASMEWPLTTAPEWLIPNPNLEVLADITFEATEASFVRALEEAPTLPARVFAVRALKSGSAAVASDRLRRLVADKSAPVSLRVEAVRALAARKADADLRSVATSAIDRWEVREATTAALGEMAARTEDPLSPEARARIGEQLAHRAVKDTSLKVRAAALRAIGNARLTEFAGIVREALETNSHADTLRQAALDAVVAFDTPESLAAAIRLTDPRYPPRTRAAAAGAIAKSAKHDPEAAYTRLAALLSDRQVRTRVAAGDALVEMGDTRALEVLNSLAGSARGPEVARQLRVWERKLRAAGK